MRSARGPALSDRLAAATDELAELARLSGDTAMVLAVVKVLKLVKETLAHGVTESVDAAIALENLKRSADAPNN